jgi:hypothetical protein
MSVQNAQNPTLTKIMFWLKHNLLVIYIYIYILLTIYIFYY